MKKLLKRVEALAMSKMRTFMPRWAILLIDTFIVATAYILLWLFRNTLSPHQAPFLFFKFGIVVSFFLFSSIIFKTYHGVVRFSTMLDLKRLAAASIFATVLYTIFAAGCNYWNFLNGHLSIFNLWIPIVLGMIVISGQVIFRFAVRSLFETLESSYKNKKERAFILGCEYESVLLAQSLLAEQATPYQPVAYICHKNLQQEGKKLGGLPILNVNKGLNNLMKQYNVKTLLLYKSQIDTMPREFYDNCIVEGIELLMVNTFEKHSNNTNGDNVGDDSATKTASTPQINKIKIEDLLGRNAIIMNRNAIEDQFIGETILITGAAGSIGGEISKQVKSFKCKRIIILDQAETPLNDLYLQLISTNGGTEFVPVVASVTNKRKMRHIFEEYRPSLVFHAAAYKHVPMMESHPSTATCTNVGGTKIIADLSAEYGVKRFVMVSTDKAVNPTNVMGATKRAAEIYIQSLYYKLLEEGVENPTQFVTTRFGNVLGSNGSVVPLFKKQIEAGGPVTVTHRDITRFFMTIPEACSLVLEAGCTGKGGEIYIFDMGEAVKIYDLAEKMIRLSGKTPGVDIKIIETGLRPGEKLYEELLSNKENTMPTYHKKVMIAKVRKYCFSDIAPKIENMIATAAEYNKPYEVVKVLKTIIPEYHSQNSVFESIDKEIEVVKEREELYKAKSPTKQEHNNRIICA